MYQRLIFLLRFVLERHLKREEVIFPRREVGKFRGEPVYRRANVLSCKTSENWMRVGRKIKDRQEPMKWVKQRAMTLNRRREVELAKQNGEESMQGLYSVNQTELYRPPPIQNVSQFEVHWMLGLGIVKGNLKERKEVVERERWWVIGGESSWYILSKGIIPQNAFGNIDLYAPTMLPEGARHLPCELELLFFRPFSSLHGE